MRIPILFVAASLIGCAGEPTPIRFTVVHPATATSAPKNISVYLWSDATRALQGGSHEGEVDVLWKQDDELALHSDVHTIRPGKGEVVDLNLQTRDTNIGLAVFYRSVGDAQWSDIPYFYARRLEGEKAWLSSSLFSASRFDANARKVILEAIIPTRPELTREQRRVTWESLDAGNRTEYIVIPVPVSGKLTDQPLAYTLTARTAAKPIP